MLHANASKISQENFVKINYAKIIAMQMAYALMDHVFAMQDGLVKIVPKKNV
jgi:hypothetical protein